MENNDILSWSKEHFLKWSDFKADFNPAAFEDSFSQIRYHHTWIIDSEMSNGDIYFLISNIKLETQFLKHLSWVKLQNASSTLLDHEQGHFDLAEFMKPNFEELLKKKFYGIKFPTRGQNEDQRKQFAREDSGYFILKELKKFSKILEREREKYSEETDYGKISKIQKAYQEKFRILRI